MTIEETGKLLDEIVAFYPNIVRKDTDMDLLMKLWNEALYDQNYKEMHDALISYTRTDEKGYVPTVGQLIELTQDPLCPPDHVDLGVWKEGD